ncbi:LuxR C-terminal-related transcriptional regulator [Ensifer adhaerens]|uniref:transcriptional regulator VisN n=1 Tax=Ensifer adhaerens TaxID=106592 RepID=UPI001CBFEDC4|nr:LuxR family transcriptional regulator [Ensifer adhaerens]MBZ7920416.1 LuxR C-terminal-related transcriptional regulator [Ensifer adhaerens]UAX92900.1 LuxR C-terminal-related transcriptional regulator [Ensifer adhaerens]UAY00535.1 LuxR C-terminal-related transcriptional regulator [Ensifer adhaerens]UAY07917.1 LuxR C-terminal-related transcriptional regulator [Ensifer adhaerens]
MNISQADIAVWPLPTAPTRARGGGFSREQLLRRLGDIAGRGALGSGLAALTEYVGAGHYLLARYDLSQDNGLDFVVCSDWPFDVVRRLSGVVTSLHAKTTELEKCLAVLQPCFYALPDDIDLPRGMSREYCAITFNVGSLRFSLMLLVPEDVILSQESLRDVTLLAGYLASFTTRAEVRHDRDFELTERELECLFWIAEGKTSEEIAVILGISRNTINNYITSVMRKTATRTRSEAIAYAVRNNLV